MSVAPFELTAEPLYAVLSLDHQSLLLPQRDVMTLESVLDVRVDEPLPHSIGWLPFTGAHWPVYGFDDNLHPQAELPPSQRLCVLLNLEGGGFGILWPTHCDPAQR